MAVNTIQKSDSEIISLLSAGTYNGWEYLYDKYAPLMYGTIMRAVAFNKTMANELLIMSFVELKKKGLLATSSTQTLALYLVQHCYKVINKQQLSAQLMLHAAPYLVEAFPLLQAAIKGQQPLKILAAKIGITEASARATLRSELQEARKKISSSKNCDRPAQQDGSGNVLFTFL